MTAVRTLVVMEGDQTGQELGEQALRVIDPAVTGFPLEFERYDLSLESRRTTGNAIVHEAAAAMRRHGIGLKSATVTPDEGGDVGSPNALLREAIDGRVIIRTGRRLPGVRPIGGIHAPISVVRMAVDDAYGAKEYREGEGDAETAWRLEHISRRTAKKVAQVSFEQARKLDATVMGGPKWTVSPIYEGMFKEELDACAQRNPDVRYRPLLIDALLAALIGHTGDALVVPTLNRDGDLVSDMVLQLFGSIAGSESLLLSFGEDLRPVVAMAEAPHGTAPTLEGKDIANPLAMILAAASVLPYIDDPKAARVSRAIYEASLEAVAEDVRTADLGGQHGTVAFTDEVIKRVRAKLDVWESLGSSGVGIAR